jgi:WD40 repeat protein
LAFPGATPFGGHAGPVHCVAFSPDGTAFATGGQDGTVRLWDAATRQQTAQLTGHTGPVTAVAYSPDGTTLATGSSDGTARLWDTATAQQTSQLTGHTSTVLAVAYSPDGTTLATAAGREGTVRLWDTATRQQTAQLTGHTGPVNAIAYSPDGTTLATAGHDAAIRLWDTTTRQQTTQLTGHTGRVNAVAYSPDGTTIATSGSDRTARLWDTATARQTSQLTGHTGPVLAVAYSPDGTTLATGGSDGTARLWDTATAQQTSQLTGHTGPVHAVAYSPDGTTLATSGSDRTARLWDTATARQTSQLTGHTGPVLAVAYSPDGTTLATSGYDATIRLWDTATGQQTAQLTRDTGWVNGWVNAVAYSPDGTTLATGGSDATIRLWDTTTLQQTAQLTGHSKSVNAVAYSPDGSTLATASKNGTVRLWNTATRRQTAQLAGRAGAMNAIAYSPDGTTLATTSDDATIRLWDTATGQQRTQLTGHTSPVTAVAYSPDGRTLASVSDDGTIRIWNPVNGAQVNGTGFGVPRAPARPLAGVRSDSPSATDLLGVGGDVETLAELIAATETAPPLAIALIGDWGAGKSSVMLQVSEHIDVLADRARHNPGLSAFAENVRQVRFNAWHYSDDQLWAGLVSHLFEVLADAPGQQAGAAADVPRQQAMAAERERLRNALTAERKASDKLAGALSAADAVPRPAGVLGWLGSPLFIARVLLAAGSQAFGDVRAGLAALLGWAILGVGAYAAWYFLGNWIAAVTTAVAVAAPPVALAVNRLRSGHGWLLAFTGRQRAALGARQQEYQRDIRSLEDQLVLVDAAARLARFVAERGDGTAYQKYQGLLGQVRSDLERLSADLTAARGQWVLGGRLGAPPLERIVLYIDDLDRCPPRRVVEVLEAVHLMLALDLFVVVVAVDARWLIQSLEYNHRELFGHDKRNGATADGHRAGRDDLATPIDYLDKIFQIPYVLLPPAPEATAAYLRALLPEPLPAARPTPTRPPARPEAGASDASGASDAAQGAADVIADDLALDEAANAERADGALAADAPEEQPGILGPGIRGRGILGPGGRGPLGMADRADETVTVDLRPQGLRLSQVEVEFMARLGGLARTPRAAKRLVNIYRLVRIGVPDGQLSGFVGDENGGPYQAVQVLLAILMGHPEFARKVFRTVIEGTHGADLLAVVAEVGGEGENTRAFGIINDFLTGIRKEAGLVVSSAECRAWCPQLARFSFYTRDLAGPGLG